MKNRTYPWSGYDLIPLAYESLISCLLRLAWRNSLNEIALRRHFSITKAKFYLDLPTLLNQTGWYLDEIRLRQFEREYRNGRGTWLADSFRYCPLCLECGYHTDLFQCLAMTSCPFHEARLSTHCHCCNQPTARYEVAKALFRRPYMCHVCGAPISGAAPSLDAHLDLRADIAQYQMALQPYEDWWQKMEERRNRVHDLRPEGCLGLQAKWCNSPELLRAVACQNRATPTYVRPSHYDPREVVVLAWRYRINLENCGDFFTPKSSWKIRVAMPMAVYRCTLKLLARWLAHCHGWTPEQFIEQSRVDRGNTVSAYPVDLLAFMLVRWQLESRFSGFPDFKTSSIAQAQLDDQPSVGMHSYSQRTPRLAWRAIFLAIYASWHARIASGKYKELTRLRNKTNWDAPYIFSRNRVRCRHCERWFDGQIFNPDEAWFEGEVCFLSIKGLPLQPWVDPP